jgi:isoleucyl-tRNA synthetase
MVTRFLVANTSNTQRLLEDADLNIVRSGISTSTDGEVDRYILHKISELESTAIDSYEVFNFSRGEPKNRD